MLDGGPLGVGGQRQDEDAPPVRLRQVQRGCERTVAQVGRDRDGVGGQGRAVGQVGLGVAGHRGTDVAALDVEDRQGADVAQGRQRLLEHRDTGAAVALEEGGLRFDGGNAPAHRVNGP